MNISRFFITRPVFAGVISIVIFLVGAISLWLLPVSEYPEVVPPSIVVTANYPGASAGTISETVASPLEQSINGTENMLYMSSQSTANGVMTLTVTFKLGTDVDKAQMQVQNKVAQALPKLPEEVRRFGVTTIKSSPNLTMVVHLHSPNDRYDALYLRNYANLHVKDELARLPGVGQVQLFGGGDYAMRVWLNPDKVASYNLTPGDIVRAIQAQNVQVAAGAVGQQPVGSNASFELVVNAPGRLITEEEFSNIIVKKGPHGETVKLSEMARLELGSGDYALRSLLNGKPAVGIPIFQLPGANAIDLSNGVRARMAELKEKFPEGLDYQIAYDPTVFVKKSINAVIWTLLEAIVLVVIVVVLFLQTWRASIIPLAAVPVSLVGTFAVMHALGFSINNLSLFGLVLAIGIVVDDAIVVVENVERNIGLGLTPKEATQRAMSEVTGPIIATALVLCAVFVPTAFISGLTGQFYKQFAITIAISTVISAFNSLTLSPALSALLLKGHGAKKDIIMRAMDATLGWFFRPFNRFFDWSSHKYVNGVRRLMRFTVVALVIYGGLVFLTWKGFEKVPPGFIPQQDKQYLVAFAQLPQAASLDRTEAVMKEMSRLAKETPGVKDSIAFPGLSIQGFTIAPNEGIVFVGLDDFEQRTTGDLAGPALAATLQQKFSGIKEGIVQVFLPPAVNGLGAIGGFKLMLTDRGNAGYNALFGAAMQLMGSAAQSGHFQQPFSGYTVNVPQIDAKIDREKAMMQRVPPENINEALQVNLGSLYVNDFNLFGRTYQVVAQADAQFRDDVTDIQRLKARNEMGQMVPIGSFLEVKESFGPARVTHYNGYLAADFTASPAPGISSGQSEDEIQQLAKKLPAGFEPDWTEIVYQKVIAGNTSLFIYPLCILLVFLVLAAQYESLRLPLAIILIVPLCLLFALFGVAMMGEGNIFANIGFILTGQGSYAGGDNNVFTQIGFIVLIGLACKNAILIVEFGRDKLEHGLSPVEAALEACRLRLRPILMTSIAFIAGVYPLVTSHGAGSEMRRAMGTTVFSGMIGVTFLGLFFTPVFFVLLARKKQVAVAPAVEPQVA